MVDGHKTILEPGVIYPLMATLYTLKEIQLVEKQLAKLYCKALGLNVHFPRALLYGSCELGGLGIDHLQVILTTTRINYFLYHTRLQTQVGKKLEISIAHLQIEIGTCDPFFSCSYAVHGYLATTTLSTCLWVETEPFSLCIQGSSTAHWCSSRQGTQDMAIMEYATTHFSAEDSFKINRCRIYLQVVTLFDLCTYSGAMIHPEIKRNEWIQSRTSTILWPSQKNHPDHTGQLGKNS